MDGVGDFVVGGVEVGGDADAGAGAEVDQDLAADEFGGDFAAVGDVEDDGAAALLRGRGGCGR